MMEGGPIEKFVKGYIATRAKVSIISQFLSISFRFVSFRFQTYFHT